MPFSDLATNNCSTLEQKRRSRTSKKSLNSYATRDPGVCLASFLILRCLDKMNQSCPVVRPWTTETKADASGAVKTMAARKHATFFPPAGHGKIFTRRLTRGHLDVDLTEKVCRHRGKTEPNRKAPARRRPDYSLTQNKAASRPIFARRRGAVTYPAFILLSSAKHDSGGVPFDSFCCLNNSNSS